MVKTRILTVEITGDTDDDLEEGVKAVSRLLAFSDGGVRLFDEDGREI